MTCLPLGRPVASDTRADDVGTSLGLTTPSRTTVYCCPPPSLTPAEVPEKAAMIALPDHAKRGPLASLMSIRPTKRTAGGPSLGIGPPSPLPAAPSEAASGGVEAPPEPPGPGPPSELPSLEPPAPAAPPAAPVVPAFEPPSPPAV